MRRTILFGVLLLIIAGTIAIAQADEDPVFLPAVSTMADAVASPELKGYIKTCETTHKHTLVQIDSASEGDGRLILSDQPDGTPLATSDAKSIILSGAGPKEGDWWVWLVNASDQRISEPVAVHTDHTPGLGKCQRVSVVFYSDENSYADPGVLPLSWDSRLTDLGVTLQYPAVSSGESFWHLVEAKWENEAESSGNHHIYVEVLDENGLRIVGQPVIIFWGDESGDTLLTEETLSDYSLAYPMYNAGNSYNIRIEGLPSEAVLGMGLGTPDMPNHTIHTSVKLIFKHTIMP